jgi:hypothetical protein
LCDPVQGVSVLPWRDGSVEFAVRYGHPEDRLRVSEIPDLPAAPYHQGAPAGQNIKFDAVLVRNPEVEDVDAARPAAAIN